MATYTVKSGDSLSRIAAKLGLSSWQELYNLNKSIIGSNPNLIRIGQTLTIPGSTSSTSSSTTTTTSTAGKTYTVVRGDTLNKIAAANNMTLSQLLALNPQFRSNPDLIRPGQVVNLGGGTTSGGGSGGSTPTAPKFDSDAPVTGSKPVPVGDTTLPNGGKLVFIRSPEGSDERFLWYVVYEWRGVQLAYEIGGPQAFTELFGTGVAAQVGMDVQGFSQGQFDGQGFVLAGAIDEIVGTTESIGSRIEREVRALGLEDLPSWLSGSKEALAIVAESTSQEWSSGRLWKELSKTSAFQGRWGEVLPLYLQEGVTIADAVAQIEADEQALREALRPWWASLPIRADQGIDYLHDLLNQGWTPGFVAQVLEVSEDFLRHPESLTTANFILEASGLDALDEVGYVNALAGYGPQETIEALNTATAARALEEAGIDLADDDLNLIMELVDTSDRLLTAESWRSLSQELSLNLIRFNAELDAGKLGAVRQDLVAAAFGDESPSGKSAGETLSMLARFERDRRAAGAGFDQATGFIDQEGRLRIQGIAGL